MPRFFLFWLFCAFFSVSYINLALAQDKTVKLTTGMFDSNQQINLSSNGGWVYRQGNNAGWANPDLNTTGWLNRNPADLSIIDADKTGRAEGWFRIRVSVDSSFHGSRIGLQNASWAAYDVYVDGKLMANFGATGEMGKPYKEYYPYSQKVVPLILSIQKDHLVAVHVVDYVSPFSSDRLKSNLENGNRKLFQIVGPDIIKEFKELRLTNIIYPTIWLTVSFILCTLFWLLSFQNLYEKTAIRLLAIGETFLLLTCLGLFIEVFQPAFIYEVISYRLSNVFLGIGIAFLPITLARIVDYRIATPVYVATVGISLIATSISAYFNNHLLGSLAVIFQFVFFFWLLVKQRKKLKGAQWAIVIGAFVTVACAFLYAIMLVSGVRTFNPYLAPVSTGFFLALPLSFLVYIALRFKEILYEDRLKATALLQVTEEKRVLLASQNEILEQQVEVRTKQLKASQAQLIQKEKLASLGELTAGIAHEIQNPLNFVNNFSEVSVELVGELREGPFQKLPDSEKEYAEEILGDLTNNMQKIRQHGGRASNIVKGMLEHSRTDSGEKRPTDLNALADEYLKIAYNGLQAKYKSFHCDLLTDFDPNMELVEVAPQEIGRVLLNLYNNAFYAVKERGALGKGQGLDYQPTVWVSTKRFYEHVEIRVRDNGTGIPESLRAKIFQPFFTTKPTGEGTGLGLSLSYDIVTKGHNGALSLNSKQDEGTEFIITLPKQKIS